MKVTIKEEFDAFRFYSGQYEDFKKIIEEKYCYNISSLCITGLKRWCYIKYPLEPIYINEGQYIIFCNGRFVEVIEETDFLNKYENSNEWNVVGKNGEGNPTIEDCIMHDYEKGKHYYTFMITCLFDTIPIVMQACYRIEENKSFWYSGRGDMDEILTVIAWKHLDAPFNTVNYKNGKSR